MTQTLDRMPRAAANGGVVTHVANGLGDGRNLFAILTDELVSDELVDDPAFLTRLARDERLLAALRLQAERPGQLIPFPRGQGPYLNPVSRAVA